MYATNLPHWPSPTDLNDLIALKVKGGESLGTVRLTLQVIVWDAQCQSSQFCKYLCSGMKQIGD